MDTQVQNAIEIAWDPQSDQNLKAQAIEFLNQLRCEPSAWQVCLSLFTRSPKPLDIVRHVSLEIVNAAIQTQQLDLGSLKDVKANLMEYILRVYAGSDTAANEVDSAIIQNKVTQTITYLFTALYAEHWQTFFDDFLAVANGKTETGAAHVPGISLYLRVASSVHDEIADVLVPRTAEEQQRNSLLKDLVRQRDVQKVAASWQEILSRRREGQGDAVIEMCLRVIGRWSSWVDISFVVNENIMNMLFDLIAQPGVASSDDGVDQVRNAAVETLTEIIGKKMKAPAKIELISFLKLETIITHLISSPALHDLRTSSNYDTDLAEAVAKLVNNATGDIVRALESDGVDQGTKQEAQRMLQVFLVFVLRFFADEYDEICSTVIPSLTDLLTYLRKDKMKGGQPTRYTSILEPILKAIIMKMKYDETSSWGKEDEQTDEAEFQDLRKRLHVLQQAVAAVDEKLYIDEISRLAFTTFAAMSERQGQIDWRGLDLVLYEMYLFGDLAVKQGGLYTRNQPTGVAAETLISMMTKMIESGIASNPHPAIQLQYMEICVRYCGFFELNAQYIPRVLEYFVTFLHHDHVRVRTRSWYLFLKFVKHLRKQLGDVAQTVIGAISDLLVISAELPKITINDDEDLSSEDDAHSPERFFNSQLLLFEAVGCISSISAIPLDKQVSYTQAVSRPLFADLEKHLEAAKSGDERAVLQIHHDILAFGVFAQGFSNWTMGSGGAITPPANAVSEAFGQGAEAVLVALESLKASRNVRTAARSAFSRLLGVLGSRVLPQLPRWIDGILSQTSSREEMATFLRMLEQVVFGFKTEIYSILDSILSPLLQRVFASLDEPCVGTDDEIQLAELRREYVSFLLIIMNNDLGAVLVSNTNQATFNPLITTIEHFTQSPDDLLTTRSSFTVLTRMCSAWGGPDIVSADNASAPLPVPTTTALTPLPGFQDFMLTRLLPLCFSLPLNPSFQPKDAQARQALQEIAGLQKVIYAKLGDRMLSWLRGEGGQGPGQGVGEEYVQALKGQGSKQWREWFVRFVSRKGV